MSIKSILIWALIIRFLIMPMFFHYDLKDHHQRVSYLYTKGVLNIYEFLRTDAFTKEHNLDFSYPPTAYFTLGIYQFLLSPFLGNEFYRWINDYSDYRHSTIFIFRYLFLLKIIYLAFELLIGLLIYKMLTNPKEQKLALFFWFFNPINLYAIYAIGQFDVIPTFFTFLSLFLWYRKKLFLSGLALGMGIAYKTFPLLLLPLFWLSESTIKKKIIFSISAILFYLLTILPFLNSPFFRSDVLFSGLSTRIFELKFSLGILDISIFVLLYALFLIRAIFIKTMPLHINILVTFFLVFATTRFHPQWIIWLMPFLTLAVAKGNLKLISLLPFFASYFLYFIFFGDSFLTTGLLSPISSIYLEIPPFTRLVPQTYFEVIKPLIQIIFAVSVFYTTFKVFNQKGPLFK